MVVEVKEDRLPDRRGKIPGAGGSRAIGSVCRKAAISARENRFHFKRRKRVAVVESREERANERWEGLGKRETTRIRDKISPFRKKGRETSRITFSH